MASSTADWAQSSAFGEQANDARRSFSEYESRRDHDQSQVVEVTRLRPREPRRVPVRNVASDETSQAESRLVDEADRERDSRRNPPRPSPPRPHPSRCVSRRFVLDFEESTFVLLLPRFRRSDRLDRSEHDKQPSEQDHGFLRSRRQLAAVDEPCQIKPDARGRHWKLRARQFVYSPVQDVDACRNENARCASDELAVELSS